MNSGRVLTGNDGVAASTNVARPMPATDRREIANEIEILIFVERGINRIGRDRDEQL